MPTVNYDNINHDNVILNNTKVSDKLISAFISQNELLDKNINEIFNEALYLNNADTTKITNLENSYGGSGSGSTSIDNIRNNFINLLDGNVNLQTSMIENINKRSNVLGNTFNYNVDMYRNQKNMNDTVEEQTKSLKKRNFKYLEGVVNDKKQIEIYNYYYNKNKTQQNILYYLFIICIIVIILTYINLHFNFFLNDAIYSIIVGLIFSLYVIYFIYSFYDIVIRDDINFNEYNFMWGKSKLPDSSTASSYIEDNNNKSNNNKNCKLYEDLMDE